MSNKVTISFSGSQASGKTLLINEIEKTLSESKIVVDYKINNDEHIIEVVTNTKLCTGE